MASYKLLLRTNKTYSDGKHPIIFKLYLGNESKMITLPFKCLANEWDSAKCKLKKNYPEYRNINEALRISELKMQSVFDDLEAQEINFNLNDIDREFRKVKEKNKTKTTTVKKYIENRIDALNVAKKYSTARSNKDTLNSLIRYLKRKETSENIGFRDITVEFLKQYELFLLETSTGGGISFKMRNLRAIFNSAINEGFARIEDYPFKAYKISQLKKGNNKIAISINDIVKFKSFDLIENPEFTDTFNIFLFSYYTGGTNFKDVTALKWSNVLDNRLVYIRSKTKTRINLKLVNQTLDILKYYKGIVKLAAKEHIFPIVNRDNLSEKQVYYRYQKCIRKYNKELKLIAEAVGIEKNLTSYVSRHSFATHLKFEGVPTDKISQALGHNNIAVTQAYLEDFGNDVIDDALDKLN